MPLYRQLGDGDAIAGFEQSYAYSYRELNQMLHDTGHAHPVSCVDCHDPATMQLRITRPGFIQGIQMLAASDAPVPHLPSRHVEYYCGSGAKLTFPWGNGLKVEEMEAFWDAMALDDGSEFYDYVHQETGAKVLKAQHPEFELWS